MVNYWIFNAAPARDDLLISEFVWFYVCFYVILEYADVENIFMYSISWSGMTQNEPPLNFILFGEDLIVGQLNTQWY